MCREAFFSFGRTLHLWMGVWMEQEIIQPYFNMACSFSSSSFWRAITARIIFLSSSVRWLKSGMSGIEADTEARGPPWGPTEAAMFLPPPSLPFSLPFSGARPTGGIASGHARRSRTASHACPPLSFCLRSFGAFPPLSHPILYLALFWHSSSPPPHPNPPSVSPPLPSTSGYGKPIFSTRRGCWNSGIYAPLSNLRCWTATKVFSLFSVLAFPLSFFQHLAFANASSYIWRGWKIRAK